MQTKAVKAKLPKFIKQITILKAASEAPVAGPAERVVVEAKRSKKKPSRGLLRILERVVRRGAQARAKEANDYLDRHNRANRKKRDGWLRKYSYNLIRAARQGGKILKLSKLIG